MKKKLLLVSALATIVSSAVCAQTINNAPQNSPAGAGDQVKQAPRTGDSSQIGGTPSGNTKAVQGQVQGQRSPNRAVTLAPEQRVRIKQYAAQHPVRPYQAREHISVGTTLPADVELSAVPTEWGPGLSEYRYVYSDNHIGLVEPSSRRVIEIIE
jgi:hypothetical protein